MGLRTIIESPSVEAEINRLTKKYPRFSEWWELGWSWRLSREPFLDATEIPETNPQTYLLKTSPHHATMGFPFTLTFLYTVSDDEVRLLNVRVIELSIEE